MTQSSRAGDSVVFAGQAFGLTFTCTKSLPELVECAVPAGNEVIAIDWSDFPSDDAGQAKHYGGVVQVSPQSLQLRIPGIAAYHVTANAIRVAPESGIDDASVRAFLFGSAVGALLHLRGTPVLHGSAVRLADGSAAVFCGHTTAGKSTLAVALARRDHALIADDTTALRIDERGDAWCLPGLARTKLWRRALRDLGLTEQHEPSFERVRPNLDKYSLAFVPDPLPAPVRWVYELRANEQGTLVFSEVKGVGKVGVLMTHTYRPRLLKAMGRQPQQMRLIADLAPRLTMTRIDRPRHQQTLDDICDRLERQWAG